MCKRLLHAKPRYLELEKLGLVLMVASRKLRLYFHTNLIEVLTNYPLHQVLQKPEASGRLLKWAIELGQFEVNFHPRMTIKGQALSNIIAKFTYSNIVEVTRIDDSSKVAKVVGVREKENFLPTEGDAEQYSMWMAPLMILGPELA